MERVFTTVDRVQARTEELATQTGVIQQELETMLSNYPLETKLALDTHDCERNIRTFWENFSDPVQLIEQSPRDMVSLIIIKRAVQKLPEDSQAIYNQALGLARKLHTKDA